MAFSRVVRTFIGEYSDAKSETWVYRAYSTSMSDTCNNAKYASAGGTTVPNYGTALGDGSGWVVTDKQVRRYVDNSAYFYEIRVVFSSPEFSPPPPPVTTEDKTGIQITVSGIEYEVPVYWDKDNAPIVNSSEETFDPPVTLTKFDEQVVVSWTATHVDTELLGSLRGKVNSDSVTLTVHGLMRSFTAGTLKLGNAQTELSIAADGNSYTRVTIPLIYRPEGWVKSLADMGYLEWGPAAHDETDFFAERVHIKDKLGQDISTPAFLDGTGHQLEPGNDVVLLDFNIEDTAAFSPILAGIT